MTAVTQQQRAGGARLGRAALGVILVLLLLPYLLTPLYRLVDPVSTLMVARWVTGRTVERSNRAIEAVSPDLPVAVLVAEDDRFCSHHGVDWQEVHLALEEADDDLARARGGSTITQQVAKNLFLWPGRSFLRKVLELPLALWIDLVLPKRRIMEIYLNIAEWGPHGEFGAEAGARAAFGKSAAALDHREAALLASILPNPVRRSAAGRGRACAGSPASTRRAPAARLRSRLVSEIWASLSPSIGALARRRAILYKRGFPDIRRAPAGACSFKEPSYGCPQAKNLSLATRDAPLRRCAQAADLCRGQGFG